MVKYLLILSSLCAAAMNNAWAYETDKWQMIEQVDDFTDKKSHIAVYPHSAAGVILVFICHKDKIGTQVWPISAETKLDFISESLDLDGIVKTKWRVDSRKPYEESWSFGKSRDYSIVTLNQGIITQLQDSKEKLVISLANTKAKFPTAGLPQILQKIQSNCK